MSLGFGRTLGRGFNITDRYIRLLKNHRERDWKFTNENNILLLAGKFFYNFDYTQLKNRMTMKKVIWIIMVVFFARPLVAQDKWEYLEISVFSSMLTNPFVAANKKDTGMYRELFYDSVKNRSRTFERNSDILNLLGERGYELVACRREDNETVYTFKRPKKS